MELFVVTFEIGFPHAHRKNKKRKRWRFSHIEFDTNREFQFKIKWQSGDLGKFQTRLKLRPELSVISFDPESAESHKLCHLTRAHAATSLMQDGDKRKFYSEAKDLRC